jgi:peptide/nickel transport system permease protein
MNRSWIWGFVGRRLLILAPLLILISLGVFSLVHLASGRPEVALLGSKPATPEVLASIRRHYHLNDPFLVQYWKWLGGVFRLDLGRSIRSNQLVTTAIRQRIGLTIFLGVYAGILALTLGVLMGVVAALRRNTAIDRAVVGTSILGLSAPGFVVGIGLLYLFGLKLQWFPVLGPGSGLLDRAWHLTLPALALALSSLALIVKITRASMLRELDEDYVAFARARGLGPGRVIVFYALRNALIPVVTAGGLILVGLLSGAVIIEATFAIPGIGTLFVSSIHGRDFPMVQGLVLMISTWIVVVNLGIDVLYAIIDPRIGFGKAET